MNPRTLLGHQYLCKSERNEGASEIGARKIDEWRAILTVGKF